MPYQKTVALREAAHAPEKLHQLLSSQLSSTWEDDIREKIKPIVDTYGIEDGEQIVSAIVSFLTNISPAAKKYLVVLYFSDVINQILTVDPAVKRLREEAISKTQFYADTNIVIPYLFEGHKLHSSVAELIDACKTLATVRVSPATVDEL